MERSKRVALFFAAEIPLVTVPMVIPQISPSLGYLFWAIALILLAYATSEYWYHGKAFSRRAKSAWIPLPDALWHVMSESEWARNCHFKDWREAENLIRDEFVEAAGRGEIRVRGRREINHSSLTLADASEPIPDDLWQSAYLQPFGEILEALSPSRQGSPDPVRPVILRKAQSFPRNTQGQLFGKVIVHAGDVAKRWPKAPKPLLRSPKPSPLIEAYRQYVANEVGSPEWEFQHAADMVFTYV